MVVLISPQLPVQPVMKAFTSAALALTIDLFYSGCDISFVNSGKMAIHDTP